MVRGADSLELENTRLRSRVALLEAELSRKRDLLQSNRRLEESSLLLSHPPSPSSLSSLSTRASECSSSPSSTTGAEPLLPSTIGSWDRSSAKAAAPFQDLTSRLQESTMRLSTLSSQLDEIESLWHLRRREEAAELEEVAARAARFSPRFPPSETVRHFLRRFVPSFLHSPDKGRGDYQKASSRKFLQRKNCPECQSLLTLGLPCTLCDTCGGYGSQYYF